MASCAIFRRGDNWVTALNDGAAVLNKDCNGRRNRVTGARPNGLKPSESATRGVSAAMESAVACGRSAFVNNRRRLVGIALFLKYVCDHRCGKMQRQITVLRRRRAAACWGAATDDQVGCELPSADKSLSWQFASKAPLPVSPRALAHRTEASPALRP
jgi:hypothetical protein